MSQHSSNPTVAFLFLSMCCLLFSQYFCFATEKAFSKNTRTDLIKSGHTTSLSFAPALFFLPLHLCDESKLAE